MDKRKPSPDDATVKAELMPGVPPGKPVDTDDNDEPFADASGDAEDETADENDAPDTWQRGED